MDLSLREIIARIPEPEHTHHTEFHMDARQPETFLLGDPHANLNFGDLSTLAKMVQPDLANPFADSQGQLMETLGYLDKLMGNGETPGLKRRPSHDSLSSHTASSLITPTLNEAYPIASPNMLEFSPDNAAFLLQDQGNPVYATPKRQQGTKAYTDGPAIVNTALPVMDGMSQYLYGDEDFSDAVTSTPRTETRKLNNPGPFVTPTRKAGPSSQELMPGTSNTPLRGSPGFPESPLPTPRRTLFQDIINSDSPRSATHSPASLGYGRPLYDDMDANNVFLDKEPSVHAQTQLRYQVEQQNAQRQQNLRNPEAKAQDTIAYAVSLRQRNMHAPGCRDVTCEKSCLDRMIVEATLVRCQNGESVLGLQDTSLDFNIQGQSKAFRTAERGPDVMFVHTPAESAKMGRAPKGPHRHFFDRRNRQVSFINYDATSNTPGRRPAARKRSIANLKGA